MKKILVINGPNLNMLGRRNKDHYGTKTLNDIIEMMKQEDYFIYDFFQSNHEGDIVSKIQEGFNYDGLIINPAAYTHTSIAIHDALELLDIPKIEVHLSDVNNREEFRKINYISSVCDHTITNLREDGYIEAIKYLKKFFNMI